MRKKDEGDSISCNVFCYHKTVIFSHDREDCLGKWNTINNLGPSEKMNNVFASHVITVLKLSLSSIL